MSIQEIALRLIDIGANVRTDPGDVADLALSIGELGVLQPVKVTPNGRGRYILVFGQRRVLASREAGLKTIPAMVVPPDVDLAETGARRAAEQLAENLHRRDLNPIDEAVALRAVLRGHLELTQAALGQQLGRSGFWISRKLALLELHPRVQELLRDGSIVEALAHELIRLPVARQRAIVDRAVRLKWSAFQTEDAVRRVLDPTPKRARRGRPRILELPSAEERSRSVTIPIRTVNGIARVTIGVEGPGLVELVVEDSQNHRVMLTLSAKDAKLIGRRLGQAYEAVAS